jgi:uncharacterized protein (UPF0548 family)
VGFLRAAPSLDELRRAELTYPERGATRTALPAGYHHVHRRARLGTGHAAFDRAAQALSGWGMHRRAGLAVTASSPVAVAGSVVVLTLGWRWLRITAPCRVVYTVDEPNRRGFAYGTLPGHPECGEEAFIVELTADDAVWFDIRAFSRPDLLVSRLGGPINRKAQSLITTPYINALRTSADDGET